MSSAIPSKPVDNGTPTTWPYDVLYEGVKDALLRGPCHEQMTGRIAVRSSTQSSDSVVQAGLSIGQKNGRRGDPIRYCTQSFPRAG